jgi:anti-anti-sigma factor
MPGLNTILSNDVMIIDFIETKILNHDTLADIEQDFIRIADDFGPARVLIDLNRIELMTSMMIGEFVKFNTRCKEANKQVMFCNLSTQIAEIFKITRLDTIMSIEGTRAEALKRLSGR